MNTILSVVYVGGLLLFAAIVLLLCVLIGKMFRLSFKHQACVFPPYPPGRYRSLPCRPPDIFNDPTVSTLDPDREYFFGLENPGWMYVPRRTIAPVRIWRTSARPEDFPKILREQLRYNLECLAPGYQLIAGSVRYGEPAIGVY